MIFNVLIVLEQGGNAEEGISRGGRESSLRNLALHIEGSAEEGLINPPLQLEEAGNLASGI